MQATRWTIGAALVACLALAGCAPLIVGAGGAVIVDEVAEDQQGGDGLF